MRNIELDKLLQKYNIQPVGNGYIDCIIMKENVKPFLQELTKINVFVTGVSWWCHCTKEHESKYHCPHGMGGPKSKYYEGWFSEMAVRHKDIYDGNQNAENYILYGVKAEPFYSECLVPGLWLSADEEIDL